jgi:hypothetical protein
MVFMENGKIFADVIAVFDMRIFPAFQKLFHETKGKPTDCYIYDSDGDTTIFEDKYGAPLKEATLDEVIECLENLNEEDKIYRRVPPLTGMLKGFKETEKDWTDGEIVILHYGN